MKLVGGVLCALLALGALCCGAEPGPERLIVGKWEIPDSPRSIEFTADGQVILLLGNLEVRGEYEFLAADRIVVRYREEGILSRFQIAVSRDELILDDGAGPVTHRRVSTDSGAP
jgi:hypothetical protein